MDNEAWFDASPIAFEFSIPEQKIIKESGMERKRQMRSVCTKETIEHLNSNPRAISLSTFA